MKIIDKSSWKRRTTYENFIKYTNPIFSISTRLDVTELVSYCKKTGHGFFATLLYFVTCCANEIEELRTRIQGDDVVLFDKVDASYIVLLGNEELATCVTKAEDDFERFYQAVKRDVSNAVEKGQPEFNATFIFDCLYVSCLPWVDITSVSNPYHLDDPCASSIPRITWGKYTENAAGRFELGMDVAAHHALIDGRQVAMFYETLAAALGEPEKFIRREANER